MYTCDPLETHAQTGSLILHTSILQYCKGSNFFSCDWALQEAWDWVTNI